MSIECRFTRDCADFMTESCGRCKHNRKRNAPKSAFIEANDAKIDERMTKGGAYFAHKKPLGLGAFVYACPACDCQVAIGNERDFRDVGQHVTQCDGCGLEVVVWF